MIFILLFPIAHHVTGEVCSAQHNIPQSGAGASTAIAYMLEEDPTFPFTEEMISLKLSECCSNYHNLGYYLFLYLLSLAGCSCAAAGSAAPLLLPVSPHSILQPIAAGACRGVSATASKGEGRGNSDRVLSPAAQSTATPGKKAE